MDTEQITLTVAAGVSALALIPALTRLVSIFPELWESLFRTGVCIRIEDNKKVQRSRDGIFLLLQIPAFTLIWWTSLYSPDWLTGLDAPFRLLAVAGVFILYEALRAILQKCIPHGKFSAKIYDAASGCPRSSAIVLFAVLFVTAPVLDAVGVPSETRNIIMLCLTGISYAVLLVRRFQIFASGSNYLTAILYLCALEILPTALLTVPALVF